jgi:hypothetical protein
MARPAQRHRRGIQTASVVIVSILVLGVVAAGLYLSTAPPPAATPSSTEKRVLGSGPISTYPASWDDLCGGLVSGNETTGGTNFGDNPLPQYNLTLTQVYSGIVNSSAFQKLAAGRSWVTLDWGSGSEGPIGAMQTVLVADFLFISGGIPDPDGYAQMTYFFGSANVTGFVGWPQVSCTQGGGLFKYGVSYMPTVNFTVGQPIAINFTFTNGSGANMTIAARTSCLANFTIIQGGFERSANGGMNPVYGAAVYDSAKHPGCAGPPLDVVLSPGKTYAQTFEWDQTYDNGTQVPPGDYWITGMEAGYSGQTFPVAVVEGPLVISANDSA